MHKSQEWKYLLRLRNLNKHSEKPLFINLRAVLFNHSIYKVKIINCKFISRADAFREHVGGNLETYSNNNMNVTGCFFRKASYSGMLQGQNLTHVNSHETKGWVSSRSLLHSLMTRDITHELMFWGENQLVKVVLWPTHRYHSKHIPLNIPLSV